MIRAVIADDEAIARAGLRAILDADPEVETVAECANGREALAAVQSLRPDLLLLDVQMPDLDGFAVLRALPPADWPAAIIFVTAFDQYAIRAFDVYAVDYLLKPFGDERALAAITRAKRRIRAASAGDKAGMLAAITPSLDAAPPGPLRPIACRDRDRVFFINTADIEWIEAEGDYVRIHGKGATHLTRRTGNYF